MSDIVFPSLETLCKKTSQDRKTVISCLDRLCDLGLLREEGAKPGGVKEYRIIGLPNGDKHYVYQLTHKETGEFYIGVRTCFCEISSDKYFGSGRWPQEVGSKFLSKEILGSYVTRKEAELAEAFLINQYKNSKYLKNRFHPKAHQVPKTPPVPKTEPVPKTVLHPIPKTEPGSSKNGLGDVPKTEHRIINESLIESSSELLTLPSPQNGEEKQLQSACRETWKSYSAAYFNRYQTEPIRNAVINTQIKSFCKRIPHHEAPHVAAFYVAHNDKFYVQKTHHPSLMSKDAEGLRTQWATNRTMTSGKATQVERTAGNVDSVNQAISILRTRNSNATV
jgi:hypothetical protein